MLTFLCFSRLLLKAHITEMTNIVFDEMLNKKGSCGEIEFNHSEHRLNLCVQKDNKDAASQSSDVKALRLVNSCQAFF